MADNYCNCCGDGTPEYIIELNQQGAPGKRGEKGEQGYSPIVDFIADDNEIRFTSTNENNITSTPNLYDYVLKKDGTNAANILNINNIKLITAHNTTQQIFSLNSTGLRISGKPLRLDGEASGSTAYPNRIIVSDSGKDITLGNTNKANIIINNNMATYNGNELATVNDISDSKITIVQGDVVKGSFTLNQSGDTTIELDTGITNPLKIEGATEDNPSGGTITYGMELGLDSSNQVYLDYTRKFGGTGDTTIISENLIKDNKIAMSLYKTAMIVDSDVNRTLQFGYNEDGEISIKSITTGGGGGIYHNIAPITTNITNYPIYLQKVTGISGLEGMYYIKLNYDNDTLKVNGDKKLYADFTPINNSITTIEGNITELTTLADNTEASLNELKTDYEANKTEVAEELTTLGNQINTKQNTLVAGNNITLTANEDNTVTISSTGGSGGGVQINDEAPSTETVYSSNKVEELLTDYVPTSTYTEGISELEKTKNQNIFDINKFTVVGSPTITDDGVLQGTNAGIALVVSNIPQSNNELEISFDYIYKKRSGFTFPVILDCLDKNNNTLMSIGITSNENRLSFGGNSKILVVDTRYKFKLKTDLKTYRSLYIDNVLLGTANIETPLANVTRIYIGNYHSALNDRWDASYYDLKQFSITADGIEVFNGLMNSTKPIYDKITTTNTALSTFKTNTTNNFSAVNSALNEKANLSDLANYVPLATYNALLARVEALEAEINGGNA